METKKFLEKVLGDGYYSVLGLGDKKVQSFHATIDDVIEKANELDTEGVNAYFGLATFETNKDRRVTNVKSLSSFYLDLDCGVGKEYTNQNEAFLDLKRFVKSLKDSNFKKIIYKSALHSNVENLINLKPSHVIKGKSFKYNIFAMKQESL